MRYRDMPAFLAICIFIAPLNFAFAVEPHEILADPAQEARAREISQNLRCLVCQNESIDESSAPLAHDLRELVRELIIGGLSDHEILDHIQSRYGEFVLLNPRPSGSNLILYLSSPVLLAVGIALASLYIKRRRKGLNVRQASLSREEKRELKILLDLNRGKNSDQESSG